MDTILDPYFVADADDENPSIAYLHACAKKGEGPYYPTAEELLDFDPVTLAAVNTAVAVRDWSIVKGCSFGAVMLVAGRGPGKDFYHRLERRRPRGHSQFPPRHARGNEVNPPRRSR